MPELKRHLPSTNQTARWAGSVYHDPKLTIITRCGQVYNKCCLLHYDPERITDDLELASCDSCLHSAGAEFRRTGQLPPEFGARGRQLLEALIQRRRAGIPLSPPDHQVVAWLAELAAILDDF